MDAIQHYGGAKPGDRTMLDALAPAITTFQSKSKSGPCPARHGDMLIVGRNPICTSLLAHMLLTFKSRVFAM